MMETLHDRLRDARALLQALETEECALAHAYELVKPKPRASRAKKVPA